MNKILFELFLKMLKMMNMAYFRGMGALALFSLPRLIFRYLILFRF